MVGIIKRIYQRFKDFWLYSVGGAIAFVVDFSLLYILTEHIHLWYLISNAVSVITAIIVNYIWQRSVTFKRVEGTIPIQFSKFALISVIAVGLNTLLMYLLVDLAELWYMIAKVFVTAVVWFWNFFGNKYYTFKK